MYIPLRVMEGILDRIDSEELASTAEVCGALKKAHERYGEYAAGWALHRLEELLGHRPTAVDKMCIRDSLFPGRDTTGFVA